MYRSNSTKGSQERSFSWKKLKGHEVHLWDKVQHCKKVLPMHWAFSVPWHMVYWHHNLWLWTRIGFLSFQTVYTKIAIRCHVPSKRPFILCLLASTFSHIAAACLKYVTRCEFPKGNSPQKLAQAYTLNFPRFHSFFSGSKLKAGSSFQNRWRKVAILMGWSGVWFDWTVRFLTSNKLKYSEGRGSAHRAPKWTRTQRHFIHKQKIATSLNLKFQP